MNLKLVFNRCSWKLFYNNSIQTCHVQVELFISGLSHITWCCGRSCLGLWNCFHESDHFVKYSNYYECVNRNLTHGGLFSQKIIACCICS